VHNIAWFQQYMARMRGSIVDGTFEDFRRWVHEVYPEGAPKEPEGKGKPKSYGKASGAKRARRRRRK
jgi:hypothetical protein